MSGRPFTIIGAVVALVALGAFLVLSPKGGGSSGGSVTLKPVVVAARDISGRVPLTAADVKVANLDSTAIPPQSFTKADQVKDLIPLINIAAGQPIVANELVTSQDQIPASQVAFLPIPKGYVARTIPTSEQQGVAGYIQPGDYITIAAIIGPPSAVFKNARTVFTNVHVLKTGVSTGATAPVQSGKPTPTPTPVQATGVASSLTIIVTQCQAEFIDWFIANGTVTYTLESYHDYTPKDVAVDTSCPSVDAAQGVSLALVNRTWPGLAG